MVDELLLSSSSLWSLGCAIVLPTSPLPEACFGSLSTALGSITSVSLSGKEESRWLITGGACAAGLEVMAFAVFVAPLLRLSVGRFSPELRLKVVPDVGAAPLPPPSCAAAAAAIADTIASGNG